MVKSTNTQSLTNRPRPPILGEKESIQSDFVGCVHPVMIAINLNFDERIAIIIVIVINLIYDRANPAMRYQLYCRSCNQIIE
jgi:hypothetical protein